LPAILVGAGEGEATIDATRDGDTAGLAAGEAAAAGFTVLGKTDATGAIAEGFASGAAGLAAEALVG
jgi:hypothetical protein